MTTQSPEEMQKFYDWFYENFSTREDCILTPDELDQVYKYAQERASKPTLVLPERKPELDYMAHDLGDEYNKGFNEALKQVIAMNKDALK